MISEYVRLTNDEASFGERDLLNSQLSILNSIKHLREYKELRKQELMFKLTAKNKLDRVLKLLKELDKVLPTSNFKLKDEKKEEPKPKKIEVKIEEEVEDEPEEDFLQTELDEIKRRLSKLQV